MAGEDGAQNYIVDEKGERVAVIVPLDVYEQMVSDIRNLSELSRRLTNAI
ncbi:MAG: hypothetical protein FWF19_04125 [Euryarchaeota archaeon]|nr:hypothetical protein [Euryarchaeota archaeon]